MTNLGKKIKRLRQSKGWTLAQLSKRSGIVLSSLSRMETGRMTGTLESHIRLAKALGIRLMELYADLDPAHQTLVVRRAQHLSDEITAARGTNLSVLTERSLGKKMLPLLIRLLPGKSTRQEQTGPEVEKFLYVVKGVLGLSAGKEILSLEQGDSLYLSAAIPHTLKNASSGLTVVLSVTSPPSLF